MDLLRLDLGAGGIFNGGTMTLSKSTLWGNSASGGSTDGFGGGIFNNGTMTVSNCTMFGDYAYEGGGIFNIGGTMTVHGCTLQENQAELVGGGIYNDSSGMLTVSTSIFSFNTPNAIFGNYIDGGGNTFS
jgi:hypothetical protein